MKIFISWSGDYSHQVALALKDWLPYIFRGIETFVSSEDIRKGKRWPLEVSKELEASNFGIVCLEPNNLEAPWILFESGALSKQVKEASLYTLLMDGLRPSDIVGPLSHFQHTIFEKEDFFKMLKAINELQTQAKEEETRLRKMFEKWWDELIGLLKKAEPYRGANPPKGRTTDDKVNEILETVNQIAKNMPVQSSHEAFINADIKRIALQAALKSPVSVVASPSTATILHKLQINTLLDLIPYSIDELQKMGINSNEIRKIERQLARFNLTLNVNLEDLPSWPFSVQPHPKLTGPGE